MEFAVVIEGFLISLGLLMAIGPQNAYLLRQGLRRRHVLPVAITCFLSDVLLLSAGVLGVGAIIAGSATLSFWLGWGGVAFLSWFALRSVKAAMHPQVLDEAQMEASAEGAAGKGARQAVLHTLAFTFLNPWVYMDTMGIVGTYGVKFEGTDERLLFLVGAVLASAVWFFGLGYGAQKAAPLFKRPITWRILDSCLAAVMFFVAALLVRHQLS